VRGEDHLGNINFDTPDIIREPKSEISKNLNKDDQDMYHKFKMMNSQRSSTIKATPMKSISFVGETKEMKLIKQQVETVYEEVLSIQVNEIKDAIYDLQEMLQSHRRICPASMVNQSSEKKKED